MKRSLDVLGDWFANNKERIILIVILLIAAFFRFYKIDSLPPGLHPDEAANGLDVFRIFSGDLRPVYNTNNGREALFFYLQAIGVAIFGNTTLALHIVPAVTGFLAVIVTYLAVKEWFSVRAGLLTAFIMASAPWAVQMSRLGFRANLMMLFTPLVMWTFAKAYKSGKWYWYVLCGLSLGGGFYTYISYRMAPFIILAILGFALWRYRPELLRLIKPAIIVALSALIALLPLIFFAVQHPEVVFDRTSHVGFTNPDLNDGKPLLTLGTTVVKTALMFNFAGDANFRHNLGGEPQLNFFVGIMFILGLLLSFRRIRDIRYFSLLVVFAGMLVPEVATAEGIPHALRAIGVIPIVYIFAAIGLVDIIVRWRGIFPLNPVARNAGVLLLVIVLGFSTFYNYQRYFVAWANAPETYVAHNEELQLASEYMINNPIEGTYYAVVDGYSNITLKYLLHNKVNYEQVDPEKTGEVRVGDSDVLLVVNNERTNDIVVKNYQSQNHYSKARPNVIVFRTYQP